MRHRGKIEAVIDNARRARAIVAEFGSLAAFIWRYEPTAGELAAPQTASTSTTSVALSKELKRRGWRFVGPTTLHAYPRCGHDAGRHWEMANVEAFLASHLRPAATSLRAEMTIG